jgi:hypothetical protein
MHCVGSEPSLGIEIPFSYVRNVIVPPISRWVAIPIFTSKSLSSVLWPRSGRIAYRLPSFPKNILPVSPWMNRTVKFSLRSMGFMLPSACSFTVLVVTVLHYMFRPTWPSSSVKYFYFICLEGICFAGFSFFYLFFIIFLCTWSHFARFLFCFSSLIFVVPCVCVCLLAFSLLFVCYFITVTVALLKEVWDETWRLLHCGLSFILWRTVPQYFPCVDVSCTQMRVCSGLTEQPSDEDACLVISSQQ